MTFIVRVMDFNHNYIDANDGCELSLGFNPTGMSLENVIDSSLGKENNFSDVVNNIVKLNESSFRGESVRTFSVAIINKIPNYFIGQSYPKTNATNKITGSIFISKQMAAPPLSAIKYFLNSADIIVSDSCKVIMQSLGVIHTNYDELTHRQKQCVSLLAQGCSVKEIAKVLHISPKTVEDHLVRLKEKFSVNKNIQIVAKCISENLI